MRRLKKAGLTLLIASLLLSNTTIPVFANLGPSSYTPTTEQTAELTEIIPTGPGSVIVPAPDSVVVTPAGPSQVTQPDTPSADVAETPTEVVETPYSAPSDNRTSRRYTAVVRPNGK